MQKDASVRRWAILLEYDGTAYGGSQYQKNAPTVQGTLERALSSLTSEPIRVSLAGRTDAGVHAKGQVASFLTTCERRAEVFLRGTNALMPKDISVRSAAEVPLTFDPRRQAASRLYRYTLHLGPQRPALLRGFVWHLGTPLDLAAMQEAAALLSGRHDFSAFTTPSEAGRRRTERVVSRAEVRPAKGLAFFEVEANAFLHQMVRRLMGALVDVGVGRRGVDGFQSLLAEPRPGAARVAAPAQGLCLMKVRYESGLFDDETNEDI